MGAGRARCPLPVVGEELTERAACGVEEPPSKQFDQRIRAREQRIVSGRLEQREHGFEQMHVRILPPRFRRDRHGLEKAACRAGHVVRDPGERVARLPDGLGRAGRARIPGEREHHEGKVIQVRGRVEHLAVAPEQADPTAVGAPGMPGQELIALARRFQGAGPAEPVRAGKDEDLPRLDPHALVRDIGRARRKVEMLDEAEAGPIAADRGPERQRLLENPFAQCRICALGLRPEQDLYVHNATSRPS